MENWQKLLELEKHGWVSPALKRLWILLVKHDPIEDARKIDLYWSTRKGAMKRHESWEIALMLIGVFLFIICFSWAAASEPRPNSLLWPITPITPLAVGVLVCFSGAGLSWFRYLYLEQSTGKYDKQAFDRVRRFVEHQEYVRKNLKLTAKRLASLPEASLRQLSKRFLVERAKEVVVHSKTPCPPASQASKWAAESWRLEQVVKIHYSNLANFGLVRAKAGVRPYYDIARQELKAVA